MNGDGMECSFREPGGVFLFLLLFQGRFSATATCFLSTEGGSLLPHTGTWSSWKVTLFVC